MMSFDVMGFFSASGHVTRRDVRCCYVIRCKVMSRKLIGRNVFLSGCCFFYSWCRARSKAVTVTKTSVI